MNLLELRRSKFAARPNSEHQTVATLTVATTATHQTSDESSVAKVATVPVTDKMITNLTDGDVDAIQKWLWWIKEYCPEVINGVLQNCQNDPEALVYYRARSKELPETRLQEGMHSCIDCGRLSPTGICKAAQLLGATEGYKPVLGRRFDHRCPEWTISQNMPLL